jgi:hypothetical protein
MRRKTRRFYILFPLFLTIIIAPVLFSYHISKRETPEEPISIARKAISEAMACAAHVLEPALFQKSESYYSDAMSEWNLENKKPIYKRNYNRIIEMAKKAKKTADEACVKSKKKAINERQNLKQLYKFLKKQADKFQGAITRFPMPSKQVEDFHQADLLMRESSNLIEDEDFISTRKKLEKASILMSNAIAFAHSYLKNYFNDFPLWKDWVAYGVKYSEQEPVLIIDKMAHKCYVYIDGKPTHEYEIEMGKNWIGQKTREGDLATPEGIYKVTHKKSGAKTIYHKALLLDYPNQNDLKRIKNLTGGKKSHRPGGMIEVHGHGGRGFNWTKGCMALSDKEMDRVFALTQVGTKVIIVGSLEPFNSIEQLYFD